MVVNGNQQCFFMFLSTLSEFIRRFLRYPTLSYIACSGTWRNLSTLHCRNHGWPTSGIVGDRWGSEFLNSTATKHRSVWSVNPHSHTGYSEESNAGQLVSEVLRGEFQTPKQVRFQLLDSAKLCQTVLNYAKLLNCSNLLNAKAYWQSTQQSTQLSQGSPGVRSTHRGKRSTKPGIGSLWSRFKMVEAANVVQMWQYVTSLIPKYLMSYESYGANMVQRMAARTVRRIEPPLKNRMRWSDSGHMQVRPQ